MPVSRIAFALADAMSEIKRLGGDERPDFAVDIHMDHQTHTKVVRELEHHFGAQLQRAKSPHMGGSTVRYSGMRLIAMLPGNKDG